MNRLFVYFALTRCYLLISMFTQYHTFNILHKVIPNSFLKKVTPLNKSFPLPFLVAALSHLLYIQTSPKD